MVEGIKPMFSYDQGYESNSGLDSLRTIAEDLKVPLHRINIALQQSRLTGKTNNNEIEVLIKTALNLVECYSLSVQLTNTQLPISLSPVPVKLIAYESQQELQDFAKLQKIKTNLNFKRNIGQVYGNSMVIKSIIKSIAYSLFINSEFKNEQSLLYSIQRSKKNIGVDVGIFSSVYLPVSENLHNLRTFHGKARQVNSNFMYGSSSGILLADKLCEMINTKLNPARFNKMNGYHFSLMPSKQLSIL